MKIKSKTVAASQTGDASSPAAPKMAKQMPAFIDPSTQRPIPRDLRFRHFVAHQRESFFHNGHWFV